WHPFGPLGHDRRGRGQRLYTETEARSEGGLQLRAADAGDLPRIEYVPARRWDGPARRVRTDDARGGGLGGGVLRREQRADRVRDLAHVELALPRRLDAELRMDAGELPGDCRERRRARARVPVARFHRSDRLRASARDRVVLVQAVHDEVDAAPGA